MPDLDEAVRRGNVAKRLLEDPLVHELLDGIEQRYTNAWKGSAPVKKDEREAVYCLLRGLQEFRQALTAVKDAGTLAAKELAASEGNGSSAKPRSPE